MYAYYNKENHSIVIDKENTPARLVTMFTVVECLCNSIDFGGYIEEDYQLVLGNDCMVADVEVYVDCEDYEVYVSMREVNTIREKGSVELILFEAV